MDHVERLERWVASGGHWLVVGRADDQLTVALVSCDDEEMGRLSSGDAALLAYVGGRTSSED